jgi:hypothetical protein
MLLKLFFFLRLAQCVELLLTPDNENDRMGINCNWDFFLICGIFICYVTARKISIYLILLNYQENDRWSTLPPLSSTVGSPPSPRTAFSMNQFFDNIDSKEKAVLFGGNIDIGAQVYASVNDLYIIDFSNSVATQM